MTGNHPLSVVEARERLIDAAAALFSDKPPKPGFSEALVAFEEAVRADQRTRDESREVDHGLD